MFSNDISGVSTSRQLGGEVPVVRFEDQEEEDLVPLGPTEDSADEPSSLPSASPSMIPTGKSSGTGVTVAILLLPLPSN